MLFHAFFFFVGFDMMKVMKMNEERSAEAQREWHHDLDLCEMKEGSEKD